MPRTPSLVTRTPATERPRRPSLRYNGDTRTTMINFILTLPGRMMPRHTSCEAHASCRVLATVF